MSNMPKWRPHNIDQDAIRWDSTGQAVGLELHLLLAGAAGTRAAEPYTSAALDLLADRLRDHLVAAQRADDEVARYERIQGELATATKAVHLAAAECDEVTARRKGVSLRAKPGYAVELQRLDVACAAAQSKLDDAAAVRRTLLQEQAAFQGGAEQRRKALEEFALQAVRVTLSGEKRTLESQMVTLLAPVLDQWLTAAFAQQQTYGQRDTVLARARARLAATVATVPAPPAEPSPAAAPTPPPLWNGRDPVARPPTMVAEPTATAPVGPAPPVAPWQERTLAPQDGLPGTPAAKAPVQAAVAAEAVPVPSAVAELA